MYITYNITYINIMKNFVLKNYINESINKIKSHDLDSAIDVFVGIKKLNRKDLLEIYSVEEEDLNNN